VLCMVDATALVVVCALDPGSAATDEPAFDGQPEGVAMGYCEVAEATYIREEGVCVNTY